MAAGALSSPPLSPRAPASQAKQANVKSVKSDKELALDHYISNKDR